MAFLRSHVRDGRPTSGSGRKSTRTGGIVRWLAVPGIGLALAAWSVATVGGLYSAKSLAQPESFVTFRHSAKIGPGDPRQYVVRSGSSALVQSSAFVIGQPQADHFVLASASGQPASQPEAPEAPVSQDPFARIVAEVSRDQVLAALAKAGMAIPEPAIRDAAAKEIIVAYAEGQQVEVIVHELPPLAERFGPESVAFGPASEPIDPDAPLAVALAGQMQLAFAMAPAAVPEAPWGSLARFIEESEPDEPEVIQAAAATALPKTAFLPSPKPKSNRSASEKPSKQVDKPEAKELAFVRPDNPVDSKPFNKLFKRQDRVAVYDISAGLVYMPDGSKLEAHSGIGKMADNPKYVHVRNSGPTPPNTYKLTMRESRFYGVEAIRMTPLTKQPMHGRDGFLTHSYLLRSRRPESHGCVAFKNYPQFLKAFKQGKVTHLVVVPSYKDAQVSKGRKERGA